MSDKNLSTTNDTSNTASTSQSHENSPNQKNNDERINNRRSRENVSTPLPNAAESPEHRQMVQNKSLHRHHLRSGTKSQSLFNFSTTLKSMADESNGLGPISSSASSIVNLPPTTSLSNDHFLDRNYEIDIDKLKLSAKDKKTSDSSNDPEMPPAPPPTQSEGRQRVNSIASDFHPDEIDDMVASQTRVRASIISLFGKIGILRRTSNNSNSSRNEHDRDSSNDIPLRAFPQIAAAKILRAFSYVGMFL